MVNCGLLATPGSDAKLQALGIAALIMAQRD
jgi:hypothetical protein